MVKRKHKSPASTRNTRISPRMPRTQLDHELATSEISLEKRLERLEYVVQQILAEGSTPSEEPGFMDELESVASSLWNGAKSVMGDLGVSPADLIPMAMSFL
jgi:hypothetical protein